MRSPHARDALARNVTLRAMATMLARQVREDGIHAASLTILGQIAPGTPFDPDRIADAYWAIRNEDPAAWQEEYRFEGAPDPSVIAASRVTS